MDPIGIRATGRYLPKDFILTKDIIGKEGLTAEEVESISTHRVFTAKDEEPTDMAIKAAKKAIDKADINPEEIDVVVYSGVFTDYIRWSDAARVQYEIGAKNSYAFKFEQGCSGAMVSIDYGFSRLKTDYDINNILVVSGDKFEKPIINRWKAASANYYGDGASAGILSRENVRFNILGSHSIADGRFNHLWKIPIGGVAEPATEENVLAGEFSIDCKKTASEYLSDDIKREQLYNTLVNNNKKVMLDLLERLNYSIEDVDKVVLYNLGKHVLDKIIPILGIDEDKTSTYISYQHGHMGCTDILFNLDKMLEDGKFEDNDKIMLFSAGAGFTWSSTLLEYRRG